MSVFGKKRICLFLWMGCLTPALCFSAGPTDARARYRLVRRALSVGPTGLSGAEAEMRALWRQLPENGVVRMRLGEVLLRLGKVAEAQGVYEAVRHDLWGVPDGAMPFLSRGLSLLEQGKTDEALRQMIAFENVQKGSFRYQSAVSELAPNVVGLPVERFRPAFEAGLAGPAGAAGAAGAAIPVKFVDATRDRKSTRLNSSHSRASRMPSSA